MAKALGRSRSLAEVIDREQAVVEDAQSALLVDLARIAVDSTAREAQAAAAARRSWWAEARECLLGLLSSSHGGGGGRGSKRAQVSPRCKDGDSGGVVVDGGNAGVGATASEPTVPRSATSSLALVRSRLEKVEAVTDSAGIAGGGVGGGDGGGGSRPLHVAVKKKQHRSDEAIRRCADAIKAARSDPQAWGGDGSNGQTTASKASPAAAGAAEEEEEEELSSSNVSSKDGGRGGEDGAPEEEEMSLFLSGLEAEAVQLAAASFEAEVRRLVSPSRSPPAEAAAAATEGGQTASPPSTPSSSPEDRPPGGLTRSQLDLRRVGRVRNLARALGEVLRRGREALVREAQKVTAVLSVSEHPTPSDDFLGGLDHGPLCVGLQDARG